MSKPHDMLPGSVVRLLDGRHLEDKVGQTVVLLACEQDAWPRMALLSVGEVLARSPSDIRLALYARSGTTLALLDSGKALLVVVAEGRLYKVRLAAAPHHVDTSDGTPTQFFTATVVEVVEDRVPYAVVEDGIRFSLRDPAVTVDRWLDKVAKLDGLTP